MSAPKPDKKRPKTKASKQRQGIVVMGMHRSGTSALAGVLSILGCSTPRTAMSPNGDNEKGFFESVAIYELHKELLQSAASDWSDWLPITPGWFDSPRAEEFHERAVATMEQEFGTSRLFVLKDPRLCRLLPFWKGVLRDIDAAARYVFIHRNPFEVAASLQKRDAIAFDLGVLIWLRHVLDGEAETRGAARVFTSFDQLMDNWAGVAKKLQDRLDLHLPRLSVGVVTEVESFLSSDLRHHSQSSDKVLQNPLVSDWIRDTFEIMNRWAAEGEDSKDHARLDDIRAIFDATAPLFARIVQAGRESAAEVRKTAGHLEKQTSERAKAQEELATLKTTLQTVRAENEATLEAAQKKETAQANARKELEKELTEVTDALSQTRSALEQRSHEAEETHRALEDLRSRQAALEQAHKAELDQAQKAFEALEHSSKTERAQLTAKLEQRSQEAEETHRALEDLRSRQAALEEAHKAELDQAQKAVQDRDAQVQRKIEEIAALDSRLETERRALADLTRRMAEQEAEHNRAQEAAAQALDRETGARAEADARLAEAQKRSAESEARYEEARKQQAEAEARYAEAQRQHAEAEARQAQTVAAQAEELSEREAQLKTKHRELADMARLIVEKETENSRVQAETTQALERESSARRAAESQLTELQKRHAEARRQHEEVQTLQAETISARAKELSDRETQIKAQQRELADMARLMAEKEAENSRAQETNAQALDRESRAREAAESRLAQAETQHKEAAARQAETVSARTKALSERDSQIRTQQHELANMARLMADNERAIRAARAETEAMLNAEKERAERAEFAVMDIKSSTSWRLMAPFRALGSVFRRSG